MILVDQGAPKSNSWYQKYQSRVIRKLTGLQFEATIIKIILKHIVILNDIG